MTHVVLCIKCLDFYHFLPIPCPPCQDSPANCAASQADAADPTPEQLAVLMASTRSEPSRVQWDGGDGGDGDDGDGFPGEVELDVELPGEGMVNDF